MLYSLQSHFDYYSSIDNYRKAWNFLKSEPLLTLENLLKTAKLITDNPNLIYNRRFTVNCGAHKFPPMENMKSNVENLLKEFQTTNDVAKFVHDWLGKLHVFQDGNGRLCRLVIAWHYYPKYVLFKYNREEFSKWVKAVHSSNPDLLRNLIQESVKTTNDFKTEIINYDDNNDTTTKEYTTTRTDCCSFCVSGIIDCCNHKKSNMTSIC
jgi:Fic family protein